MLHQLFNRVAPLILFFPVLNGATQFLESKDTLSVIEMDHGDAMHFTLRNGRTVSFELLESHSDIVLTTLDELKKGNPEQRTIYRMTCRVRVDGQDMELVRYVPVQQTFSEPYSVNGLNIWFDAVQSLDQLFNENHGPCLPLKDTRFAFWESGRPIAPEPITPWFANPDKELRVNKSYGGEDLWMGPYFGADLHGGLDINTPSNTTLYSPIRLDDQFYFNSLAKGDNNNRWRGIREWPNGDTWTLQTHHLVQSRVPENIPIEAGTPYAYTGGVRSGYTAHTHFVFKVQHPGSEANLAIDPWLLFRESFRRIDQESGSLLARMSPLAPGITGEPVAFSSTGSRHGLWGQELFYYWDFGDGFSSTEANPRHRFVRPGLYAVSLYVTDGAEQAVVTRHMTVSGSDLGKRALHPVKTGDRSRAEAKPWKTRAAGDPLVFPCELVFAGYRKQTEAFLPQTVVLHAGEAIRAPEADVYDVSTNYIHGDGWLNVESTATADGLKLIVQPEIKSMIFEHGFYRAQVRVSHPMAISDPVVLNILVDFRFSNPASVVTVENSGEESERSAYFWLAPEFHMPWVQSISKNFLINADNQPGEFVRFTPNLEPGEYAVELAGPVYSQAALMTQSGSFTVVVHHRDGADIVVITPSESTSIGTFAFNQGRQGYVEIQSDGSTGLIFVDALRFTKVD